MSTTTCCAGLKGPRGHPGANGANGADGVCECKPRVCELEEKIKRLEEMVEAMWFAPGMPGSNQIQTEVEEVLK